MELKPIQLYGHQVIEELANLAISGGDSPRPKQFLLLLVLFNHPSSLLAKYIDRYNLPPPATQTHVDDCQLGHTGLAHPEKSIFLQLGEE